MGGDVRTTVGVPKLSAFANGSGTPLVIDTATGVGYFTDKNTVVPITGGGASGGVTSVNGETGVVVIDAADVGALPVTGGVATGNITGTNFLAPKLQIGTSPTPANNFTLDASAANSTMKLARNDGFDLLTVANTGVCRFPLNSSGAGNDRMTGGNQVRMGRSTVTFDGTGTYTLDFGVGFSTSVTAVLLTNSNTATGGEGVVLGAFGVNNNGCQVRAIKNNPYGVYVGQLELSWMAIGV